MPPPLPDDRPSPGANEPDIETVLPAEVRPPVVSRTPPPTRKFPCGKCGAKLDFDPASQGLKCPYCGYEEGIALADREVTENDYEAYLHKLAQEETTIAGRSSQVTCPACGAVVLLEDKIVTDHCPFCTTHLESEPESAQAMLPPEWLLPFAVTNRQARDAFNRWIASRWFAPTALRQLANLGRLDGVYIPYWTYDSMTYTRYSGMRGDNYTVTETYTETNAQGQTVTKTRQVTRIRWTPVSGSVSHFFDDVLICASASLPEKLVDPLAPWDLQCLAEFRPDYLSSFKTERYAVGLEEGFARARAVMDGHIHQLCLRDIGGDHQQLNSVSTRHASVTFKHLLLPIWLANYRYHDQLYRILINGRTGAVVGTRPYSWVKIVLLIVAILALVAAVVLAIHFTQGKPSTTHSLPAEKVGQGRVDGGILEAVAQRLGPPGQDALAGGHNLGHLAEDDAQREAGRRQERRPMQRPADRLREVPVREGIWGGAVDRPGGAGVIEGQQEQADDVVAMDPGDPLPARADRPAGKELERRQQLGQGPSCRVEHHADAHHGNAQPHALADQGGLLPLDADASQEVVAGRAILGQLLVAVRPVVADGRGVDQDAWIAPGRPWTLRQRLDTVLGAAQPAVADHRLVGIVPAPAEDILAGQVDHRVAVVDLLHPGARLHRVALDDGTPLPEHLPGLGRAAA